MEIKKLFWKVNSDSMGKLDSHVVTIHGLTGIGVQFIINLKTFIYQISLHVFLFEWQISKWIRYNIIYLNLTL